MMPPMLHTLRALAANEVRGRIGEDLRSGIGGVTGATPVGSALFLAGRWLGACAHLGAMVAAFMFTMLVLHALRGDGPLAPLAYLQTYVLLLLPMVFFAASCAILFDSWAPLMGKGGDVLFFMLWMMQLALMTQSTSSALPVLMVFDFSGLAVAVAAVQGFVGSADFAIGLNRFDPALAPVALPSLLWSARMPGQAGQVLAEIALTFIIAPSALLCASAPCLRRSPRCPRRCWRRWRSGAFL
jgi:hypothetical protein